MFGDAYLSSESSFKWVLSISWIVNYSKTKTIILSWQISKTSSSREKSKIKGILNNFNFSCIFSSNNETSLGTSVSNILELL